MKVAWKEHNDRREVKQWVMVETLKHKNIKNITTPSTVGDSRLCQNRLERPILWQLPKVKCYWKYADGLLRSIFLPYYARKQNIHSQLLQVSRITAGTKICTEMGSGKLWDCLYQTTLITWNPGKLQNNDLWDELSWVQYVWWETVWHSCWSCCSLSLSLLLLSQWQTDPNDSPRQICQLAFPANGCFL